jgi:hypothetical protein
MNENRRQILEMLAAGKITADEAERLLTAIEPGSAPAAGESMGRSSGAATNSGDVLPAKARSNYLRVLVEADESMTGIKGATTVNVRVPLKFLRAGVRLASLIPAQAHGQLDEAFSKHGVPVTLSQLKPENLEELIDHLEGLTVDVDGNNGKTVKVKVFCE